MYVRQHMYVVLVAPLLEACGGFGEDAEAV